MLRIPERALIIKKTVLVQAHLTNSELAQLLTFEKPFAESKTLAVYGPYFDFESLEEVCQRLSKVGLEYWDDFFDLKEDVPAWLFLGIFPEKNLDDL